jgi:hypothetical protein
MTVRIEWWFGWSKVGICDTFSQTRSWALFKYFWLFLSQTEIIFVSGFSHLTGNHSMHGARDWLHDGLKHFHEKMFSFASRLRLPTPWWWTCRPGPRWAWQCRGSMGSDRNRVTRCGLRVTYGRLAIVYGKSGRRWPDPDVWSRTGNWPESEHQIGRNRMVTDRWFCWSLKVNKKIIIK